MNKTRLRKYAYLIASKGANVKKGQEVFITAELDQPEFVEMLVKECYKLGAKKVVVMAATIGFEIEKRTELYKHRCLKDSVILDACATAYIESVCDETEDEIRRQKKEEGLFLTTRFSPGYGDFPITLQKDIISLTGADKRIGLTVTKSNILLPRKSVTAVMGITENSLADKTGRCSCCSMANGCEFKKNGKQCIL